MKKRLIGIVLALSMLVAFAPCVSAVNIVDSGFCGVNVMWELDEQGILTISGEGNMGGFTDDNQPWKAYNQRIRKIIINQGVTSIGYDAFSSSNVSTVEIANSVKQIDRSFNFCYNLKNITIPEGVEELRGYVFNGCYNLESINLPDSLKYIDCYMCKNTALFDDPANWKDGVLYIQNHLICADDTGQYTIPENYTIKQGTITIASEAFSMCENIKSITLPESVKYINKGAFSKCNSLESINFPDSINIIGNNALKETALYADENNWIDGALYIDNHLVSAEGISGELKIKSGIITIADGACESNKQLTSVVIPYGVKYIGAEAFSWCYSLQNVEIPNSVSSIGHWAFMGCRLLKDIEIPNSVREIESSTFSNSGLENINLPDTIISIGSGAFSGCPMDNISLPDSVVFIGEGAFMGCRNLSGIIISDEVTYIGAQAFSSCDSLAYVYIPHKVKYIGFQAFSDSGGELYIEVSKNNTNYCDIDGVLFNKDKTKLLAFGQGYMTPNYSIPDSVDTIGASAFRGERNLKYITIPDNVTVIEDDAFDNCLSLKELILPKHLTYIGEFAFFAMEVKDIAIPDSVNYIGNSAFSGCSNITNIVIPSGITEIHYWTFMDCRNLKSITLPESVANIERRAFEGCDSLSDVYYGGTVAQWNNVTIDYGNDILTAANIHYGKTAIEPIPITTISVNKTELSNKWQFDVTVGQTYEDSYVYVAFYDENNILTSISRANLNQDTSTVVETNKSVTDKTARIYVWNKYMQPITEAKVVKL